MTSTSVQKLQQAGYVFLRKRDIPGKFERTNYAIMQSTHFGAWSLFEKFETKAQRDRRLKELDQQPNIIVDMTNDDN